MIAPYPNGNLLISVGEKPNGTNAASTNPEFQINDALAVTIVASFAAE